MFWYLRWYCLTCASLFAVQTGFSLFTDVFCSLSLRNFSLQTAMTFHCACRGPNFLLDLSSQILFTFCNKNVVIDYTADRLPWVSFSSLAKLSFVKGRVNGWRWGTEVCFGQCFLEVCFWPMLFGSMSSRKEVIGQCRLSEDAHDWPFVVLGPTVFLTSCI